MDLLVMMMFICVCVCLCACPGSWAACGPAWSSSTLQPTAAWETTTWFTSTLKRRSASLSSSRSSPHTSSFLPTSTSPHVSPAPCLLLSRVSCSTIIFSLLPSFSFLCSNTSTPINLWNVPKIQTHAYCAFVCARVLVCQGCSCLAQG